MACRVDAIWFVLHVVIRSLVTTSKSNANKVYFTAVQTVVNVLEGFHLAQTPRPPKNSGGRHLDPRWMQRLRSLHWAQDRRVPRHPK